MLSKRACGLILIFPFILIIQSCGLNDNKNGQKEISTATEDSVEIMTNIILHDSTDFKNFEKRARFYLNRGQIDPAFRDISQALELKPDQPSLYLMLADIYFLLGNQENCFASLRKASDLNPKSELPFLKLAETNLMIQDYNKALSFSEQAIKLNPENDEGYYYKGIVKMEMGDTAAALNNLKIACNLDTLNYKSFMQVGGLLSVINDTTAEKYFHAALRAKPGDESALFLLGLFYQEHGKFEKAIDAYRIINEFYPQNQKAFYNLGYIYLVEINEPEKALEAFRQAIAVYPKYLEAIYNLGRTYEELGQYAQAREQYELSLKLLPNYPLAVQSLNRLDDMGN